MEKQPAFSYTIRSQAIAEELGFQGFDITSNLDDSTWIVEAPETMSATKARKVISTVISLYEAAKEMGKAQTRYQNLVTKLEQLNASSDGNIEAFH